jgi:glycosyltransferase involved in cell wall biosynthesis
MFGKKLVGSLHTFHSDMTFITKQNFYGFICVFILKWVYLRFSWWDIIATSSIVNTERLSNDWVYVNSLFSKNTFDINIFTNKVNEMKPVLLRSEWGGDRILLYIGRISVEKCLKVVLLSLKKANNNRSEVLTWVIVGDGPEKEEWTRLHKQEISKNVYLHCIGEFIPYEHVPHDIKAADAIIRPCNNETCGFTAMKQGYVKKVFSKRFRGYKNSNEEGLFFNESEDLVDSIEKHSR